MVVEFLTNFELFYTGEHAKDLMDITFYWFIVQWVRNRYFIWSYSTQLNYLLLLLLSTQLLTYCASEK